MLIVTNPNNTKVDKMGRERALLLLLPIPETLLLLLTL